MTYHPDYLKNKRVRHFDFDDMVMNDITDMIEFVIQHSKRNQLHFVGHSMGGILGLAYLSRSVDNHKNLRR